MENQIRQTMTKKLSLVAIMPDSDQIVGLIIVDVKVNTKVVDLKVNAKVSVVEFKVKINIIVVDIKVSANNIKGDFKAKNVSKFLNNDNKLN